eukprot:PLAT5721.3.p1 GENE.PLAT5721.3~~PLAT5721.3.p1  ORF type:complete len:462 (+),score=182.55 PLAT5721.3:94-1479(+)
MLEPLPERSGATGAGALRAGLKSIRRTAGSPAGGTALVSKGTAPPRRTKRKRKGKRKGSASGASAAGGDGTLSEVEAALKAVKSGGRGIGGKEEDVVDKQSLCVDILAEGYVQAYVDFFYLTHRPASGVDGGEADLELPLEELMFLKENLTSAEVARRRGDTDGVYEHYNNLAQYFQGIGDSKTGIYFYEKCLEISRLSADMRGELEANHNLGLAHQALGDVSAAISFHERELEIALHMASEADIVACNKELVKVYRAHGEDLERANDLDAAVRFHEKCLEASRGARDWVSEGLANYRLGRAYVLMEDPDRALEYLNAYLTICEEMDDREGQGAACSALAAAYQTLGNTDKAISFLTRFLELAKETDNAAAQQEACNNLGVIHNRRGEFARAVEYFEQNFEIARSIVSAGGGDSRLVDRARVSLGMARGNAQLGAYLNVINYDLSSLLSWKNRRIHLPRSS